MGTGFIPYLFVRMTQLSISRGVAAAAAVALLIPVFTFAAEIRTGEQAAIAAGENIPHNAYLAGGSLVSSGSVGGDLVAAGGTLVVNGPIGADLLVAGGNVSILGNVAGDVRAAGGTIALTGTVAGDVVAAGGNITAAGSKIGGDAILVGGAVRLTSPVAGAVRIRGGQVVIDAPITGDVEVHAQSLTLGSHAVILGNLTYQAPKSATMDSGASVKGKTEFTPIVDVSVGPEAAFALLSVWILSMLAALIVSALIVRAFVPKYVVAVGNAALERPWRALGMGFLTLVAIPAAAFVMLLTVVGVPLGILTFIAYAALLVFSWMMAPVVVGAFVEKWWHKRTPELPWQVLVYGALVYAVLGLIPVLGGIFKFVVLLVVLGTVIEKKWEIAADWV